jgi:hypothetical protein
MTKFHWTMTLAAPFIGAFNSFLFTGMYASFAATIGIILAAFAIRGAWSA